MKFMFATISSILLPTLSYAAGAPVKTLQCQVLEAPTQGQSAIEDTPLSQMLTPLSEDSFSPGGYFAEIKYTTKDGLFEIDAEGIKVDPSRTQPQGKVVRDYLPIWIKNMKTGERIASSGNPAPTSIDTPNNDITSLSGEFPISINVTCEIN